jgi:hypothetical protein
MKHLRQVIGFIVALLVPLLFGGQVFAATESVTREITITAVVPSHRDILIDKKGNIVEINSNTKDDVTPDVYSLKYAPENKRDLTPEMYAEYRKYVPAGTAKYGNLYKRPPAASILSVGNKPLTSPFLVSRFM